MGECALKASQYPMRVLSELHLLYTGGHLVDTTITLAECGTVLYGHRCVLVAAFPYFKKLMDKEQISADLTLKNISSEGLQKLLNFVYTGELDLSTENAKLVLRAAQRMQVPEAVSLCQQFMSQGKETEAATAKLPETLDMEGDYTSEEPNQSQKETEGIKTEPGVIAATAQDPNTLPVKRGRGRPRTRARQEQQEEAAEPSSAVTAPTKRRIRKPRHLLEEGGEGQSEYRPPQVPSDMKLKLYKLMKGGKERRHSRKRKSKLVADGGSGTEWEAEEDQEEAPASEAITTQRTMRKRGRPRKGEEAATPRKKVKVKEEEGSLVTRTQSKRGRRARSSSGKPEGTSIPVTETLPTVSCTACPCRFYHQSILSLHLRKHHIHTHITTVTQCYTAVARLKIGHLVQSGDEGYSCLRCKKTFNVRGRCLAHVVKRHVEKRECRKCKQRLGNYRSQLVHRCPRSKALSSPVQVCSRCFQVVGSQGLLDKHWQQAHPGEERPAPWKCRHCGHCVVQKPAYISHLVGHGLSDTEVQLEFTDPSRVPLRSGLSGVLKDAGHPLPFKCPRCEERYKSMAELTGHYTQRHNQKVLPAQKQPVKKIRCEEEGCEQVFLQMRDLRQHINAEHPDCTYDCYLCKYTTPVKKLLRSHLKYKHTTIEDRTCLECGKHFKKRYHYRIHMVSKHGAQDSDVKVFRCEVDGCDYKTYARYVLDIHMKKHDKEKKFACNICGRKLKSQKAVEKHTNKVHMGIRPFICDICGASYGEEHELKMHIVRHNDIKQYQCEHCDYATHDKGNFQSHQLSIHKIQRDPSRTQYTCDVCGFMVMHKTRFQEHLLTHSEDRPNQCQHCNQRFSCRKTLRQHIDWKHSIRPKLKCQHCSFAAPTKNHLKTHVRIMHTHPNLKPYKCSYCDYRCNLSGNCRKHIKQKHKGLKIQWIKVAEASDETRDQIAPKVENLAITEEDIQHTSLFDTSVLAQSDEGPEPVFSDPSKGYPSQHPIGAYEQEAQAVTSTYSQLHEQHQPADRGIAAVVEKIYKQESPQHPLVISMSQSHQVASTGHHVVLNSQTQDHQQQTFLRLPLTFDSGAGNMPSFGQGFPYLESGFGFSVYPSVPTSQSKSSETQYNIM